MTTDDTRDPQQTADGDHTHDTDSAGTGTEATAPLPLGEPTEPTRPLPLDGPTGATETSPGWTTPGEPAEPAEPAEPDDRQRVSGRHPLSIGYLVAGLVFLGVAISWGLRESGVVDDGSSSWLFPLTLVVVGAIGLAASVVSSARRS